MSDEARHQRLLRRLRDENEDVVDPVEKDDPDKPTKQIKDRSEGYVVIPNCMPDKWLRVLGPTAFSVWVVLKAFCRGKSCFVFPRLRQTDWAAYMGITADTFSIAIRELEQHGLIEVERPTGKDRVLNKASVYNLNIPPSIIPEKSLIVKKVKPLPEDCRFEDPIFGDDKYIFAGKGPNPENPGSCNPGKSGVDIKVQSKSTVRILDTKVSIKDTGVSSNNSEPLNSSPPNIPPDEPIPEFTRKEKPPAKVHISPGSFTYRAVEEWNKLPGVNHHSDMTTKTAEKIARYIPQLIKGTFFIRNRFATDFIEKRIPAQWSNNGYKFTEQQILEAIKLSGRFLINGYFPPEKNNVPKSLSEMIYNPRSGTSWLLWALAHPPQPERGNGNSGRTDEIPDIEWMLNRKLEDRERENTARNMTAMREYWEEEVRKDGGVCTEGEWRSFIMGYIRYLGSTDFDVKPYHFKPDNGVFVRWIEE